jgi:transcriptional regulator with XRE-family HTH domain
MELSKYIGKKIKARREHLNITQDELAEMMNTSRVTITRYENGSRKANQDALFELAKLLNVSISYFYPEQNHPAQPSNQQDDLTKNQKLVAYSIDPDITDEERKDIINLVKIAMKNRRRI